LSMQWQLRREGLRRRQWLWTALLERYLSVGPAVLQQSMLHTELRRESLRRRRRLWQSLPDRQLLGSPADMRLWILPVSPELRG